MSELKAIRGGDIHDDVEFGYGDEDRASVLYYLKSEADKVFAELEESHKKEVEQLLIEIAELKAKNAQADDDVAFWKAKAKGEM